MYVHCILPDAVGNWKAMHTAWHWTWIQLEWLTQVRKIYFTNVHVGFLLWPLLQVCNNEFFMQTSQSHDQQKVWLTKNKQTNKKNHMELVVFISFTIQIWDCNKAHDMRLGTIMPAYSSNFIIYQHHLHRKSSSSPLFGLTLFLANHST